MLPLQLAWKFLNEGRVQTLLILAGVTVGVAAYVFITATMQGVQANLLDKTLGSQAHLSVIDDPPPLTPIYRPEDDRRVLRQVVPREPRQDPFDQWQRALTRVESTPGIVAACPILEGSALALRGGAQQGVLLVGADPDRLARIIDLPGNLVDGVYRPGAEQAVIGRGLADDLGLDVGSNVRISTEVTDARLRVVGIFSLGSDALDGRWVVTSLRGAQNLLGRPGDVTSIDATVDDVFAADTIAKRKYSTVYSFIFYISQNLDS